MPELAEVEHSRRQWNPGIGKKVVEVCIARPGIRVFRQTDVEALCAQLPGHKLVGSEASGKQMLFRFSGQLWIGIHLGMSGDLRCEENTAYEPRKHDHFILCLTKQSLVYQDTRHFGRVRFHQGAEPPAWWTSLAPSVVSEAFTFSWVVDFLKRRGRAPLKAVLLMQERFPGVGNWMADEILWRARLHPATLAGTLDARQQRTLWQTTRRVCRDAIRVISDDWSYPESWLFRHRWERGGECPRCHAGLEHATIGGRTTCWCPQCQPAAENSRAHALKSR